MTSVPLLPDRGAGNGTAASAELLTGDLFGVLWRALADILGTAATATLLRRAARGAAPRWPELLDLAITRESFEYRYRVPASWNHATPNSSEALRDLVSELWSLLVDLTGSVVVSRLAQIPELVDRGVIPPRAEQS
jgi:hypothetical protein